MAYVTDGKVKIMKDCKSTMKIYWLLAGVLGILALVMCVSYFVVFSNGISHSISDWEAFGSYFSAVISLANLVFFIIITIYIAKLQDKTSEKQLNQEKEFQLFKYKWDRLTKLSKIVDGLQELAVGNISCTGTLEKLYERASENRRAVYLFCERSKSLFDSVDFNDAIDALKTFEKNVNSLKEREHNGITQKDASLLTASLENVNTQLISLENEIRKATQIGAAIDSNNFRKSNQRKEK